MIMSDKRRLFVVIDVETNHTWTIYDDSSIKGFKGEKLIVANYLQPLIDEIKGKLSERQ